MKNEWKIEREDGEEFEWEDKALGTKWRGGGEGRGGGGGGERWEESIRKRWGIGVKMTAGGKRMRQNRKQKHSYGERKWKEKNSV